jgi:hypothetical protein
MSFKRGPCGHPVRKDGTCGTCERIARAGMAEREPKATKPLPAEIAKSMQSSIHEVLLVGLAGSSLVIGQAAPTAAEADAIFIPLERIVLRRVKLPSDAPPDVRDGFLAAKGFLQYALRLAAQNAPPTPGRPAGAGAPIDAPRAAQGAPTAKTPISADKWKSLAATYAGYGRAPVQARPGGSNADMPGIADGAVGNPGDNR